MDDDSFAFYWGTNFLIGFAIVVSLFKPQPGNPPSIPETLLVAFVTFALTACANVFLMLWVKTTFNRESVLKAIWKYRFAIDLAIAVAAMIYYQF